MNGLDNKFNNLVLKLQEIKQKEYPLSKKSLEAIDVIGQQIRNEELIDNCEDKYFAKQLMMANNVPEKYWE